MRNFSLNTRKNLAMLLVLLFCLAPQPLSGMLHAAENMSPIEAADTEEDALLRWLYTGYVKPTLQFYLGDARVRVDVVGVSDVYQIDLTVRLDQELAPGFWINLTSWPASSNSYDLSFFGTYPVSQGYRYRVTVDGTVYSARGSEPVSAQVINTY